MGANGSSPITEKDTDRGGGYLSENIPLEFGVSRMQGYRKYMEDDDVHNFGLNRGKEVALFGVFDGHGGPAGARCSRYVADNLLRVMIDQLSDVVETNDPKVNKRKLAAAMSEAFAAMDDELRALPLYPNPEICGCQLSQALGFFYAGSTAEVVLITKDEFVIANLGDSRVVLCRNGELAFATQDHKPWEESEFTRIEANGSFIRNGRVQGDLAVSRAFGDFAHKNKKDKEASEQTVSCVPWVTILDRHPGDEFLIIACDGVWDVFTNEDAVDFVRGHLKSNVTVEKVCEKVIDEALFRGSTDNLTCMVVIVDQDYVNESFEARDIKIIRQGIRRHSRHESIFLFDSDDDVENSNEKFIYSGKDDVQKTETNETTINSDDSDNHSTFTLVTNDPLQAATVDDVHFEKNIDPKLTDPSNDNV